ncbi:hypothetical protein Slin15195_G054490 [Septoria linicola]|uniref:Uncharacterized protein n=1 Tax=Septoria linicola TaxID=215465 RepID=A0A9Q9ANC1_9PEZI|nr:hypothetical protein Slin14017_G125310 [Septoria linicola]USW52130.1 hypothetical protein Slin15195_G054490 [Septoria linicola]
MDQDDYSSPFAARFRWNDEEWELWNAMVAHRDSQPAVAPPSEGSTGAGYTLPFQPPATGSMPMPVICLDIKTIPAGRQAGPILQCGICMSFHLFSRKAELQRHMETHVAGQ